MVHTDANSDPLKAALARHQAGDVVGALPLYALALEHDPASPAALYYGAMAARATGEAALALERFQRLLHVDREAPAEVHYHTALTLAQLQRDDEAIDAYRRCLARSASFAPAHNNLGNLLRARGEWAAAEMHLSEAIRLLPDPSDALYNRAVVRESLGRTGAAIEDARSCLKRSPDHVEARQLLVSLLLDTGARADALALARAGVKRRPDLASSWIALAEADDASGDTAAAITAYERALAIDPKQVTAALNLGLLLAENGETERAQQMYGKASGTSAAARLRSLTLLPAIPDSEEAIDEARRRLKDGLACLAASAPAAAWFADPAAEFGDVPFYLNYHGRLDDHALLALWARALCAVAPGLTFNAPHLGRRRRPGRWRVGICSAHLHDHSVGRSLHAMIAALPRDLCEVHILRAPPVVEDAISRRIDAGAVVHRLAPALVAAQRQIASLELDLLYFGDVGMESLTYYLACARLAPLQWTGLGHPSTTGLDTIDAFVSNAHLEDAESLATYSERVIALPAAALYPDYPYEPFAPERARSRVALGLPEGVPILVCPQSLFKLMPQFDIVLAAILERSPTAHLLLPEPTRPGQKARFLARMRHVLASGDDRRIAFFPRGGRQAYLEWIHAADLMLDPFPVSGGISTWDALITGVPIVTRPSTLARGRLTAAALREAGDIEGIVTTNAAYIEEATRRLHDRDWARQHRARIRARAAELYADRRVADAFARTILHALQTLD